MGYLNIPSFGAGNWKDSASTVSTLPAVGNSIGDVRTVQDTGIIYYWNGSAWVAAGGGGSGITQLTGDVTAGPGTGSVASTVVSVGGSSAANVHSAELSANAATSVNTPSTIVKRDSSGNFSAGTITASLTGHASLDVPLTQVGAANGVASLDSGGKVPVAQLPSTVMLYLGAWDASTNTPTLADGTGTNGDTYRASVAGTQNLGSGPQTWAVGDLVIYNGSIWQHCPAADGVSSVNSQTGAVTVNAINQLTGDITAGPASGSASAGATLATVNSNVGSFGTASNVSTVTVNAKGLVTAASNTSIQIAESQVTNLVSDLAGKQPTGNYITALTGDVVAAGPGSVSGTIQTNVVTNAKLAQMAANTLKGNNTGVTANALDLTVSQVNTMLGDVTTIGAFNNTSTANGLDISGNTLSLHAADGTNPGAVSTGTQTLAGDKTFSSSVSISPLTTGSVLFSGASGLVSQNNSNLFWDNSNLRLGVGTPSPITQLHVPGKTPSTTIGSVAVGNGPLFIDIQGNYGYVVDTNGQSFVSIDISNPTSPIVLATLSLGSSQPEGLSVKGNYAYVGSNSTSLLSVIDISNPFSPTVVGTVGTGANPNVVWAQGNYVYIANAGSHTFQVADVTNPTAPVIIGSVGTDSDVDGLYVQDRYAYIVNYTTNTLQIIDLIIPTSPSIVSTFSVNSGKGVGFIYVQGRYAYITDYDHSTLFIVDVKNPASPVSTGSVVVGTNPEGVWVEGRYCYTANRTGDSFSIVDVSNPASPSIVATVSTGTNTAPQDLTVQGRYLYVANYSNGNAGSIGIWDLGGAYVQQFETGGMLAGTMHVRTNGKIFGDLDVAGGLNVGANALFNNNLSISGNTTIGSSSSNAHTLNTTLGTPAAGVGTFTNLPSGASGNPTGYIQININGTNRFIPFW